MANIENLYRGKINSHERFFLGARLTSGVKGNITTGLSLNNNDPFFLLCMNRYENSGVNYHRYYWSNDPNDYVLDLYGNSQNEGALEFYYTRDAKGDYNLYYNTRLNYQKFNNDPTIFGLQNIQESSDVSSNQNQSFTITFHGEDNALEADIFTSVAYDIVSSNDSTQNWNFRTNNTAGLEGAPFADFNTSTRFEISKRNGVGAEGIPAISTVNELSVNGFTNLTGLAGIDEIPANGLVYMEQGANSEYFTYSYYDNDKNILVYDKRGLFNTTSFTPNTADNLVIKIALSNQGDNFKTLSSMVSDYKTRSVKSLEIFFIPASEYSYLAGGNNLKNISNYTPGVNSITYYNYFTGDKFYKAYGIRDISFLTNYLNGTLPTNFGSITNSSYPLLPVYDEGTDVNTSTALLWTNSFESRSSYIYSYCKTGEECGNCMGLTSDRAYFCHATHDTIEKYKNSIDNNDNEKPLSDNPKKSQNKNIYKNYTIPLISVSVWLFITIILVIFLVFEKINVDNGLKKLISS